MVAMEGRRCCSLWILHNLHGLLAVNLLVGVIIFESAKGLTPSSAPAPAPSSFIRRFDASSSSRRSFVATTASVASSFLLLSPVEPVSADSPSLMPPEGSITPLRPGGSARYQPVILGEWNSDLLPPISTQLGTSRILATELAPLPQTINPFADQELYYAPFLFGAWNVTATLQRKIYPYGVEYLPSKSLWKGSPRNRDEQVGNVCSYEVHYFSTLANTLKNQLSVNFGTGVPATQIIQDRAFNAVSVSTAYKQFTPVQSVEWDYRDNPGRVVLDFGSGLLTDDLRPLGPRRAEVFLTARQSESIGNDDGPCTFAAAERSRTVTLAPGAVVVSDTETVTEFHKVSDDFVTAVSRIAVYLSPNPNSREGVQWQQVGGKAVAFFDYQLSMRRILEEFTLNDDDSSNGATTIRRACVKTPRDVVQCY